jgi:hypothetical protein
MDGNERRIRNLERAITERTVDFNASFENLDSSIGQDDPRLSARRGRVR